MTKADFLAKFTGLINGLRDGEREAEGKLGPIVDRNKCDFTGIYALFNNEELVYVGKGYTPETHTVKERLSQYISKSDSGNTILKKVMGDRVADDEDSAIEMIKNFEFIAFEHNDIENKLIEATKLKWNIHGIKK